MQADRGLVVNRAAKGPDFRALPVKSVGKRRPPGAVLAAPALGIRRRGGPQDFPPEARLFGDPLFILKRERKSSDD
jgi:hypothetical protein